MRHPALLLVLACAGCTWSNSLYQARRLTGIAERAEREGREFDAGSFWGQVVTKADSAYAREPSGMAGAEAQALRGRALARLGDCGSGVQSMERGLIQGGGADWQVPVLLELARCQMRLGNFAQAIGSLTPLAAEEGRYGEEASLLLGRALLETGDAERAMEALARLDPESVRWERMRALIMLGRTDEALEEAGKRIGPEAAEGDWEGVLRILAARDPEDATQLLERLAGIPDAPREKVASWRQATAEGMSEADPAGARALLWKLVGEDGTPSHGRARLLLAELEVGAAEGPQDLRDLQQELTGIAATDPVAGFALGRYRRFIVPMLADIDSLPAGAPTGDLAMFHQAEVARDSLGADRLAEWFFLRLEQQWPASEYLPKALLARISLPSDSAEVLRDRFRLLPDNPYAEMLRGRDTPAFRALEDSLGRYISGRFAQIVTEAQVDF